MQVRSKIASWERYEPDVFDVRVLSPGAWAAAIAVEWRERLLEPRVLVQCLPSGKTPIPVYSEMARWHRAKKLSFAGSTVVLLDEFGGLEPHDTGRCLNMLRHDLLDHVDLRADDLIAFDPDSADLDVECVRISSSVSARGGLGLTLLGIGTNGHVGMNEPGSSDTSATRRVELEPSTTEASSRYVSGGTLPTWGVTLGMREILASDEVWLLATGERKAGVVSSLLKGSRREDLPASLFVDHPRVVVWLDSDAAGGGG